MPTISVVLSGGSTEDETIGVYNVKHEAADDALINLKGFLEQQLYFVPAELKVTSGWISEDEAVITVNHEADDRDIARDRTSSLVRAWISAHPE